MNESTYGLLEDGGRDDPFFLSLTGTSWCDGSYRIDRNASDTYVLEYILQGEGTVTVDGLVFTARKGDACLLHPGCRHTYRSDSQDPWIKVWMNFKGRLADALVSVYGLVGTSHFTGIDLADLFEELHAVAREGRGSAEAVLPKAALLLHRMLARIGTSVSETGRAGIGQEEKTIRNLIDRSLYQRIRIRDLAREVRLSPSQTLRRFRKAFGTTPMAYLLERRVETAKLLLCNTTLSVKEISHRLVFADEHYFSDVFKSRTGMPPGRYRRNHGLHP